MISAALCDTMRLHRDARCRNPDRPAATCAGKLSPISRTRCACDPVLSEYRSSVSSAGSAVARRSLHVEAEFLILAPEPAAFRPGLIGRDPQRFARVDCSDRPARAVAASAGPLDRPRHEYPAYTRPVPVRVIAGPPFTGCSFVVVVNSSSAAPCAIVISPKYFPLPGDVRRHQPLARDPWSAHASPPCRPFRRVQRIGLAQEIQRRFQ